MRLAWPERPADINTRPPEVHWGHPGYLLGAHSSAFDIVLGHGNSASFKKNSLEHDVNDLGADFVKFGWLRVAPQLRRKHIGTRLTQSMGALARTMNADHLEGEIRSEISLDIFRGVFGDDRLALHGNGEIIGEAIDLDAARARLVAEGKSEDPEHREFGFPVVVNLVGLNVAGWEMPVERGVRVPAQRSATM